ncbi:MAG: hypothetical protein ABI720_01195 [Actinomycetes bacterium]
MSSGQKRDEPVLIVVVVAPAEKFSGDGVADADAEVLGEPLMGAPGWLRSTPSSE